MPLTHKEVWAQYPLYASHDDASQYYLNILERARKDDARYNHMASPIKFAFVRNKTVDEDTTFNTENWNDPFMSDIRKFLYYIDDYVYDYELLECETTGLFDVCTSETASYKLSIISQFYEDQTTVYINVLDKERRSHTYASITWYKSRGRTEKFLQHDLTEITLEEAVIIHKAISELQNQ